MIVSLTSLYRRPVPEPGNGLPWDVSHVMFGGGRRYYWRGEMTLSIKWFFGGTAYYDVGTCHYALDDDHYLVLNEGRTYTLNVESATATDNLVVFFETGLAEDVRRSLVAPPTSLLDDPVPTGAPVDFVERLYPHDDVLSPAHGAFRSALPDHAEDQAWVAERLEDLMGRLLRVRGAVTREVDAVPGLRPSTREEIYRRLHRARDFMYSSLDEEVPLDAIARVACLSPSHLLRTFKEVFGRSPHQYLTDLRVERAKALLERTDLTVTDVCLSVGYTSLGSFSRLFRRHVGLSPEQYRVSKKVISEKR
jgi:AraC-like DNA-binding protein